jgi:hypothetical protein
MWMPEISSGSLVRVTKYINPRTPEYAGLFLEFARWFDKQKMEKSTDVGYGTTLDTPRNGEAALAWVHQYGVLGLGTNPYESFAVVGGISSNAADIAAERLGRPDLEHPGTRAYSTGHRGGKHETVERFVFEACEANVVLKLYEAATASTVDIPSIARFMSKRRDFADYFSAQHRRFAMSDRERYSEDADDARSWAIRIVEDAVTRKVESDVYPTLLGEPGAYKEAWGFKSLLGAMWFQMRSFMLGEIAIDYCLRCGDLFRKTRRNRIYCDKKECGPRYRSARSYERKKERQERAREATKLRLKG